MVTEYVRPSLMKLFSEAGIDFVFFEYEHTYFSPTALADTVLAARDSGLPPIAKTPQLERQEVSKLLECGVIGIQLPRTESRAQVEELRGYLKFPPAGTRAAAAGMGNSDYSLPSDLGTLQVWMDQQDAETTLIVHIETRLAYENAEEIVGTPGVDMVYVGPGDFSIEMGHPGQYDHPDVVGPIEDILELCKKHGIPFETTASGVAGARKWIDKGATFFLAADELGFIRRGAAQLVEDYRALNR
jgi:2-dehydro-3-deoxyglucarate aldolase